MRWIVSLLFVLCLDGAVLGAELKFEGIAIKVSDDCSVHLTLQGKLTDVVCKSGVIERHEKTGRIIKVGSTVIRYSKAGEVSHVGTAPIKRDSEDRITRVGVTNISRKNGAITRIGSATIKRDKLGNIVDLYGDSKVRPVFNCW